MQSANRPGSLRQLAKQLLPQESCVGQSEHINNALPEGDRFTKCGPISLPNGSLSLSLSLKTLETLERNSYY